MPSRWLCWMIVGFWLGTTGMLIYQEVLPQFITDNAPSYTIDLLDEARQQSQTQIMWKVFQDDGSGRSSAVGLDPVGLVAGLPLSTAPLPAQVAFFSNLATKISTVPTYGASTSVTYREKPDDSFAFSLEFNPSQGRYHFFKMGIIKLHDMTSLYRVNRSGQLLELEAKLVFSLDHFLKGDMQLSMKGRVENEMFLSSYRLESTLLGEPLEHELPPLKMSYHGSILQPLHPINRIRGLRLGQTWRMPMINPLQDALKAGQPWGQSDVKVEYVIARVAPNIMLLPDCELSIPCMVINYDDASGMEPRTWVQMGTGLVLRQEASPVPGTRVIMQRRYIFRDAD